MIKENRKSEKEKREKEKKNRGFRYPYRVYESFGSQFHSFLSSDYSWVKHEGCPYYVVERGTNRVVEENYRNDFRFLVWVSKERLRHYKEEACQVKRKD